ncbi:MAG: hypothetical protein FDW93_06420 [Bergeyella sp.]|nr:hypothetical protein [Bergeyella sp.]
MEIKVIVELGTKTFDLINGFKLPAEKTVPVVAEKPVEKAAAPVVTEKPKRVRAKAEEIDFASLDDDARLEAIKTEVTQHTKKGKSADIKALLNSFDAGRASELSPEDYEGFYNAVKRYGAGESVESIINLA